MRAVRIGGGAGFVHPGDRPVVRPGTPRVRGGGRCAIVILQAEPEEAV